MTRDYNSRTPSWLERFYAVYSRKRSHRGQERILALLNCFLPGARVLADTPHGLMRLDVRDGVQREILRRGSYEPKTVALMSRIVSEGSVFVDVGAHIGQFTLQCSKLVGTSGRVVAIEANPETFSDLQCNLFLNGCSNVTPVLCAATDSTRLVDFAVPPVENRGASREAQPSDQAPHYGVGGFPLPAILEHVKAERVDVMKIDVEGAEYTVLQPLLSSPLQKPEHLIFEFLPEYFSYTVGGEAFLDFIKTAGYALFTVDGDSCQSRDKLPEFNIWARRS